jgi:hypothetical protein
VIDLSNILPVDRVSALAPTSQAGGNRMSSNEVAMTAPGSDPVDPELPRKELSDPSVEVSATVPAPGTDGKPQAASQRWSSPPAPAWGRTTVPGVVRKAPG